MKNYKNIARIKSIDKSNKKRLLKVNPNLDDENGIYILWRTEIHGYIGQTKQGILTRLSQHMSGYKQHIDLSLKKHGLYSADNKGGYKIDFIHCPISELDNKEKEYIRKAIDSGWIVKNKTGGGQNEGKEKIAEYKPPKTYMQGIQQGKKTLARELSHIIDTHLQVSLKPEKQGNKVSIRAFEKFQNLIDENTYKEKD